MSLQYLPVTLGEDLEDLEGISISTHHLEVLACLEEFVNSHNTQLDRHTAVKIVVAGSDSLKELCGSDVKHATGQAKELCEQHVLKVASAWHSLCGWSKGLLQSN